MRTIDLTSGSPTKKMIAFALPIFAGNLFQQIYSVSDMFVVGRFLGKEALAAVGACSAVMIFITSILIGLCMGSGVYFADLFGAKAEARLSAAISTSFLFIFGVTAGIMVLTMGFISPLMALFQIPEAVRGLVRSYLLITLSGLPFMFLYNLATVVLRAFGDSKTPLVFLIAASVVNVAFDFLLVIVWPLGVKGPALSTLGAQLLCGLPLAVYAMKRMGFLRLRLRFERAEFRQVARYSLLTSLQQSIMNFGILLVQGLVNSFGITIMAAFAVGVKIDTFAYMPAQDVGNAFSTYVAQNKGAQKPERIRSGFRSAILCSTALSLLTSALVAAFAPELVAFFADKDPEVIRQGAAYLRIEGAFYVLIGYLFLHYGFFRGMGRFRDAIVLTVLSLGTRVALSYALVWLGAGVHGIWWSIVVGWTLADALGFWLYKRSVLPGLRGGGPAHGSARRSA